jgi:ABC-type transport system substrate-binding protein/class 3 adenylate cyclase
MPSWDQVCLQAENVTTDNAYNRAYNRAYSGRRLIGSRIHWARVIMASSVRRIGEAIHRGSIPMSTEQSPSFAALLRHHRRVAGLTQEELAERAGLSRGAIDTLERGTRRTPRKETVALLAEALALGPDDRATFAAAARRTLAAALAATPAAEFVLGGHDGNTPAATAAATLPRGVVTFLFADIEGSTQLLHQLGSERYADVLAELQAVLRVVWAVHAGHELGMQEDHLFVVFAFAEDALAAVAAAQQALAAHRWPGFPEGVLVRLRMGVHSGTALLAASRYVGLEVQWAARIAATGHGGQIVVSQAVVDEVTKFGYALPEGARLRDLGTHRLPGLGRRERLSQLELPGLQTDFPPLRTQDAWPQVRTNLVLITELTLVLLTLAGLLLPLVVPTFSRTFALVAGGVAVLLLVGGGVAVLLWQGGQPDGASWPQALTRSLTAMWRNAQTSVAAVVSLLLCVVVVLTTLVMTRPPVFLMPTHASYDYSYTYHRPTHIGGSAVIWTTSPIHTLTSPALNNGLTDEVYRAVWDACLVQLPDLNLPSLEGWKADQCTTVPTVANGGEDPIAERWTVFHIDSRAKWSDGQPLTAPDFLFAFRLITDPNVLGSMDPCPCNNIVPPWSLMRLSEVDPYTIRIDWSVPYYDYLTALAQLTPLPLHEYASGPYAGVFNPTTGAYNSALARQMATQGSFNLWIPVDNGPFMVRHVYGYPGNYQPDVVSTAQQLVLARNPHFFSNFFHPPVALDQVTFKTLFSNPRDPAAGEKMIAFYRQGDVTVVDSLGPPDLAYLGDIASGEVVSSPGQIALVFSFNQRTTALNARANGGGSIFTDLSVRKAFVEAFDRCGALRAMLGLRDCSDHNFVTDENAAPSNPDYDQNVILPAYNPPDAARLLDQAGYPVVAGIRRYRDGITPLALTLSSGYGTEAYQGMAHRLQQDYARNLHIAVYLESPVGGLSTETGFTGAFDIGIAEVAVGPDPSQNLVTFGWDSASIPSPENPDGNNIFGLTDPWVVTQGQLAARTGNEAQRAVVYKDIARHVAEQLDFLPVLIVADIALVQPTLCNYKKWPSGGGYLWNLADWYLARGPSCP